MNNNSQRSERSDQIRSERERGLGTRARGIGDQLVNQRPYQKRKWAKVVRHKAEGGRVGQQEANQWLRHSQVVPINQQLDLG